MDAPTRDLATLRAQRWAARRTFHAQDLPCASDLARHKGATSISVVLPARNEESTVGDLCATIARDLVDATGLVDELLVIDAGSTDDTAARARDNGATVLRQRDLIPEVEPTGGKGDSMWRSLTAVEGDIVVWIDADIRNFAAHFVTRLVAPLLIDESIDFVKAFYRRPLHLGAQVLPDGGGRVTKMLARPLLAALFPELGAIAQPLSGEYAGRRDVLETLPFFSGYSVEAGLLIDLLDAVGLDAMAQADLDVRVHRNRPIDELAPMAAAIARTILRRAEQRGRLGATPPFEPGALEELERPPVASLHARPDAAAR